MVILLFCIGSVCRTAVCEALPVLIYPILCWRFLQQLREDFIGNVKNRMNCILEALVYYDEVYGLSEEGSVKEFLRTCKKAGLDYNYGGS